MPVVALGSTRLLESGALTGRRVAVVCNPASIDASFGHIADRLFTAPGVTLTAILGPQHGYHSDVQDNMIETAHARDARRRVPVYSLYSETREPTPAMLDEVDVLIVDLQDVGCRIYTYIYTMANCFRAARRRGIPVVVCDRPNPIGGEQVEGPVLEPGFESFVGQFPIPIRHGMTIGELARLFNEAFGIGCELQVSPMTGWMRASYWVDTGLPWVMPSPNMPTPDSAMVFPGTVLFEGTNLSEGRGTTRPFELVGAPWVDADRVAAALNERRLEGVYFRPAGFEPTFQKHARQPCKGCQIHVQDRTRFQPALAGVSLLEAFRRADPEKFRWRDPPYEYEHDRQPIDLIAGSSDLRRQIDTGVAAVEIAASWRPGEERFRALRDRFLLY